MTDVIAGSANTATDKEKGVGTTTNNISIRPRPTRLTRRPKCNDKNDLLSLEEEEKKEKE